MCSDKAFYWTYIDLNMNIVFPYNKSEFLESMPSTPNLKEGMYIMQKEPTRVVQVFVESDMYLIIFIWYCFY